MPPMILIQLNDPWQMAKDAGVYPGTPTDRTLWDKVQNDVGLSITMNQEAGPIQFQSSASGRATAAQYPALAAAWLAWQDVRDYDDIDQSKSLGAFTAHAGPIAEAFQLDSATSAVFVTAFTGFVATVVAARDQWITDYPSIMAFNKAQTDYQAAFARGTVYAGPNVVAWPREYVQEGPVTLPDGNTYMVAYDPRNTDTPDGISVFWWKGATWKPATISFPSADPYSVTRWNIDKQPQNIQGRNPWVITSNNDLVQQTDPGTGDWYFYQWQTHDAITCPPGWVLDGGALISARARASLMVSFVQTSPAPATPNTAPAPSSAPVLIAPVLSPIQPVPAVIASPINPTNGAVQNTGGGIAPVVNQQPAPPGAVPGAPSVAGYKTVGAVVVAGVILYLLTRGD